MPATLASASGSMSTPPPKKKRGFFSCRSKHALDSLPRNARGSKAAIHQLQARDIFQREADDFLALTPAAVTEEKGPLSLGDYNRTTSSLPPSTLHEEPVKKLYAQEVVDGQADETAELGPTHYEEENEKEEARDVLPDPVVLSALETPGVVRSMSVSSKTGRIKRSLSLKRSGSTASTNLIARAPPVSSADFADLPESNLDDKENIGLGDLASIRKARGRHQIGGQPLVPDISEDEYIKFDHVPIPPKSYPSNTDEGNQKPALAVSIPESNSMRAVAAALENSSDSARFRSGPSVGTPRMESPCSTTTAFTARIRDGSDDTVPELRTPTRSSTTRGFWDSTLGDESWGPGRGMPFQYVTNLSRPVSIASLRSLATPSTPPRTSSRAAGLRMAKSFSVSPLKQGTFNGFPRTFFPASTINASPRKPPPHEAGEEEDVERQLSPNHVATASHSCSHCGAPPDSHRDFASFIAKGKASRHTSVKTQTLNSSSSTTQAAATGSLRKSKSALLKGPGEATLKRWGLAEAFRSNPAGEGSIGGGAKKMVPGPAGAYITDTANMRWCSALDEIKKALKDDTEQDGEEEEEAEVQKETQTAVEADEMLARYGVAM